MRSTIRARFAAVALLLVASACSDSPVEPRSEPVDLATALGELSMPSVEAAGVSLGLSVPTTSLASVGCPFDGTSQSFVCAPIVANGLTMSSSYTLLTASGTPQSAFDQSTTDAVRSRSSVVGTFGQSIDALTIDDQRTTTLSGLVSGHHVINGNGTSRTTGTFDGQAFDETVTSSIVGLLPPLRGGNGYPRGGTVSATVHDASIAGLPDFMVTMTMTFDGTSKVAVTITSFGVTQHCTLDLSQSGSGLACGR